MLASCIEEFLHRLSNQEDMLYSHDIELFQQINSIFLDIQRENEISKEQIAALLNCFKLRWENIADDESLDYTFNPKGINIYWLDLAKALSLELNIPVLQILIPILKNDQDPDTFTRLQELPDPRCIFLGEDDVTWHRVKALFTRLQQFPTLLGTHDAAKQIKLRALTIKELMRLSCKTGDEIAFNSEGIKYQNIWDYIVRKAAPHWCTTNNYDRHLISDLLAIIDNYKVDDNQCLLPSFYKELEKLQLNLKYSHFGDVINFYGIPFNVQGKKIYLFEILVDCWRGSPDLEVKLLAVAQWLAELNPALISHNILISSAYEIMEIGPHFNINQLTKLVNQLDAMADKDLAESLFFFKTELSNAKTIDSELLQKLLKLFERRWECVMDKAEDYLRLQTGVNQPWIMLSQYLAGTGLVSTNYYRLLMPTLQHDEDYITGDSLTFYPLSSFVLSENNSQLIYLKNSINRHKSDGIFYNCNSEFPSPFTLKEKQRLRFADSYYFEYYKQSESLSPEPAVSKQTIEKIRQVVNAALYPVGLKRGQVYSEEQELKAWDAYVNLAIYIRSLPQTECDNLYKQRISYNGKRYSVADIMGEIQKGKKDDNDCVAVFSLYLMKLVIDYDPNAKFSSEIESKVKDINAMRQSSAKKVYSNFKYLNQQEACLRTQIILVSLMTHQFSFLPLTGWTIQIGDWSNKTTKKGKNIVDMLAPVLKSGNLNNIRFIYLSILNKIIKPALKEYSLTRTNDTGNWLSSILDGSLFEEMKKVCFEPETMLYELITLSKEQPLLQRKLTNFIEETFFMAIRPENDYLNWVCVNIKFLHWMKGLQEKERKMILGKLQARTTVPNKSEYMPLVAEFIFEKMADLVYKMSDKCNTLLHHVEVPKSQTHAVNNLKQKLMMDFEQAAKEYTISEFLDNIRAMIPKLTIPLGKRKVLGDYFNCINTMEGHIQCVSSLG